MSTVTGQISNDGVFVNKAIVDTLAPVLSPSNIYIALSNIIIVAARLLPTGGAAPVKLPIAPAMVVLLTKWKCKNVRV